MSELVSIKLDTREFSETLLRYMEFTKKDFAEVINTKAFFVALKALRFTASARASQIERELRAKIIVERIQLGKSQATLIRNSKRGVARINLIVNARRKRKGLPGLKGGEMEEASEKIIAARKASVGFAKAGWVWALKDLAPYVPSAAKYAETHGIRIGSRAIGSSIPAQVGLTPAAQIANRAFPKRTPNVANAQRLRDMMTEALSMAISEEQASMVEYIERKMIERWNQSKAA